MILTEVQNLNARLRQLDEELDVALQHFGARPNAPAQGDAWYLRGDVFYLEIPYGADPSQYALVYVRNGHAYYPDGTPVS